jgi:L-fuculose-phosphate aldolase
MMPMFDHSKLAATVTGGHLLYCRVTLDTVRGDIARACRELAAAGLVIGTAGNVSVRAGDLVAVTATGARFEGMTAGEVTIVDLAGDVVAGGLAPTSELPLHLGVYRRYRSAAIVHTHPPAGTALACVVDELPVIHYQLLTLGGPVRVAPYATFGTPELAAAVADALDGRLGALMANHGAITHGGGLDQAVELSLTLEWVCQLYRRAAAIGRPRVLDKQAQAAALAAYAQRRYGHPHPL